MATNSHLVKSNCTQVFKAESEELPHLVSLQKIKRYSYAKYTLKNAISYPDFNFAQLLKNITFTIAIFYSILMQNDVSVPEHQPHIFLLITSLNIRK